MKSAISGSIVALVTPMNGAGSIDKQRFDRLIEWHIEEGTDAIVIAGTTGESATLSHAEHCELVAHGVRQAAGRMPVSAGTGSNNPAEALQLTRAAREGGAAAALLVAPYYNKPSQEGLYQHHRLIAEQVDIPQLLYNVPGRTACDIELETVLRLAEFDNIVAIKDATGDLERGRELVEQCAVAGMAVYSGEDEATFELMRAGARGAISVTANVVPGAMARMCAALLAGELDEAAAINETLLPLHKGLFVQGNPIPVKWALHRLGLIGPAIRLPLTQLDRRFCGLLETAMERAGVAQETMNAGN